jgi:nuclear pore complex protein Nup205
MEFEEPLERLQNLQRDLVSFTESRLANLDRLSVELETSIEDLRKLLERKRKSQNSRDVLGATPSGAQSMLKVQIGEQEYSVSNEFRESAIEVSEELDLDELEAAKLCLVVAEDAQGEHNTLSLRAILQYHRQKEVTLDCVRMIFHKAADQDADDEIAQYLRDVVDSVMLGEERRHSERSMYWRRCIEGLTDVEASIHKAQEHVQVMVMTGQSLATPKGEALQAQRMFLAHQHETLAAIMTYIVRANHVLPEDFRQFLSKAASTETPLDIMAHYIPILICGSAYFGSDPATTEQAAQDLHKLFAPGPGQLQWKMKSFQHATTIWWLAEFSARFADYPADANVNGSSIAKLEQERSKLFAECCREKAFHLMLSVADFLKPEVWYDPAKAGLVGFLLDKSASFPHDATAPSRHFAVLTMEEFQTFVNAFVSNMPDLLRQLKSQEDDERRNFLSTTIEQGHPDTMDLERFILIVARAYQEDQEGAEDFWSDMEGNLYGFLRWASQRLPTPRVAAFCELLRAIATDEKSANHAHRFLLEDTAMISGKLRKAYAVSWAQIFTELELYAAINKNRPAVSQPQSGPEDMMADPDIEEKETPIMLEAYLRLATHVCINSSDARNWIVRDQPFRLHDHLLDLVKSASPSNVQACCFDLLAALLTDKTPDINDGLWSALDSWIGGVGQTPDANATRSQAPAARGHSEKQYLQSIAANPEVATSFVHLLNALIVPASSNADTTLDSLPFPESLGSVHRHVGMEPYVDFVLGQVLTLPLAQQGLYENRILSNVLRHACLTFAWLCLSTFNENLVVLANSTNVAVEASMKTSSLSTYTRLHPFARTMEHLFNNNTIAALFDSVHHLPEELETLDAMSPLVQATAKAMEVMNLAMKLQPTYFDIVRPVIKTQAQSRSISVANAAIASFDEVILSQLEVVVYLVNYAACKHVDLAMHSLELLKKLSASRKLTGMVDSRSGQRVGNRLIGKIQEATDVIAIELRRDFDIDILDLESETQPVKCIKTQKVLDLLNGAVIASPNKPNLAHSLLGLLEGQGSVRPAEQIDDSLFSAGRSLFHAIARCAVELPTIFGSGNVSWLLAIKRGCLGLISKLATASLTASLVQSELRNMDFLPALAMQLLETRADIGWDSLPLHDTDLLLQPAGCGVRDFMRIREAWFEYAVLEVQSVAAARMDSIREKLVSALLGAVDTGDEQLPAASVLNLIDFFDVEVTQPYEADIRLLTELNLSVCVVEDAEAVIKFDLDMVEQLLTLRKRELCMDGHIRDANDDAQASDEILAVLASLRSRNQHSEIQRARLDAVEAWTDLMSTIVTDGGLQEPTRTLVALQALQIVLPKFEKSLGDNMDLAGLFARLTLTLVSAAVTAAFDESDQQIANNRDERVLAAFRVCLKAIADPSTTPALRDVCYRTCCSIQSTSASLVATAPTETGRTHTARFNSSANQLLRQVQTSGERIIAVLTEDAFSGRGSTRVSALLFLDALVALFQTARVTSSLLRALTKLNFVPVLLDNSLGGISAAFRADHKDLPTTLSYFHTALALLLNLCRTTDGSQLVLNSGFFTSVSESQLFSTDPDIGLDIDNSTALHHFYRLLSSVLRVIVAVVAARGPSNASTVQQAKAFLTQNKFSMQAVFKRVSRTSQMKGAQEQHEDAQAVAEEFARLVVLTGFLEVSFPTLYGSTIGIIANFCDRMMSPRNPTVLGGKDSLDRPPHERRMADMYWGGKKLVP